jgi:hypothetical protein
VPADVSNEDALTGTWQCSLRPSKSIEELAMNRVWELRHAIVEKIWRTNKLEGEVIYQEKQLKEYKQSILYDTEHIDKEIFDYGVNIAETSSWNVRRAPVPVERRIKEAAAMREVVGGKGDSQDANTAGKPSSAAGIDKASS